MKPGSDTSRRARRYFRAVFGGVFALSWALAYGWGRLHDARELAPGTIFLPHQTAAVRASEVLFALVVVAGVWVCARLFAALCATPTTLAHADSIAHRRWPLLLMWGAVLGVMLLWFVGEYPGHLQSDQDDAEHV